MIFLLLGRLCETTFYAIKNQGIKVVGCLEMSNLRLSHLIRDLYVRIGWSCKSGVSIRRRSNAKIIGSPHVRQSGFQNPEEMFACGIRKPRL